MCFICLHYHLFQSEPPCPIPSLPYLHSLNHINWRYIASIITKPHSLGTNTTHTHKIKIIFYQRFILLLYRKIPHLLYKGFLNYSVLKRDLFGRTNDNTIVIGMWIGPPERRGRTYAAQRELPSCYSRKKTIGWIDAFREQCFL